MDILYTFLTRPIPLVPRLINNYFNESRRTVDRKKPHVAAYRFSVQTISWPLWRRYLECGTYTALGSYRGCTQYIYIYTYVHTYRVPRRFSAIKPPPRVLEKTALFGSRNSGRTIFVIELSESWYRRRSNIVHTPQSHTTEHLLCYFAR